jgi:hypothetical protein
MGKTLHAAINIRKRRKSMMNHGMSAVEGLKGTFLGKLSDPVMETPENYPTGR